MKSILSYIVHKKFSDENENVATEALAYILHSSEAARGSLIKFLRGVIPELPDLSFQTQQTENSIRPDMWGMDGSTPRVFIENKFWAGLTDNQPLEYLKLLGEYNQTSFLLFVVPPDRKETVWRELLKRLEEAEVSWLEGFPTSGIPRVIKTDIGPLLGITTWTKLLSALEVELVDYPEVRNDLFQLRALCEDADSDAFMPIASSELTNQRYPGLVLQLNHIVQRAVEHGVTEGLIDVEGLRPQASWERIGRYVSFNSINKLSPWFGINFKLWRKYGNTPLWLMFSPNWGRPLDVRSIIEPWAQQEGYFVTTEEDNSFAVAINVLPEEEIDVVAKSIVNTLKVISSQLLSLDENKKN